MGIKGSPGQYGASIDLVAAGTVDPAAVITHTYTWDVASTAFADTTSSPEAILRSALHGQW